MNILQANLTVKFLNLTVQKNLFENLKKSAQSTKLATKFWNHLCQDQKCLPAANLYNQETNRKESRLPFMNRADICVTLFPDTVKTRIV